MFDGIGTLSQVSAKLAAFLSATGNLVQLDATGEKSPTVVWFKQGTDEQVWSVSANLIVTMETHC